MGLGFALPLTADVFIGLKWRLIAGWLTAAAATWSSVGKSLGQKSPWPLPPPQSTPRFGRPPSVFAAHKYLENACFASGFWSLLMLKLRLLINRLNVFPLVFDASQSSRVSQSFSQLPSQSFGHSVIWSLAWKAKYCYCANMFCQISIFSGPGQNVLWFCTAFGVYLVTKSIIIWNIDSQKWSWLVSNCSIIWLPARYVYKYVYICILACTYSRRSCDAKDSNCWGGEFWHLIQFKRK